MAFGEVAFIQPSEGSPHLGMNERSSRLDDDGDLIVVTVAEPVEITVMASPDHDVSRRGGDVGPHRHLEDQTDHLLFFCHLSSRVAKHYSPLLGRFAPLAGLVTLRQTFVRRCQNSHRMARPTGPTATENARLRAISTAALTASSSLSVY